MKKIVIRAAILIVAACLTGCPSPNSGGGGDSEQTVWEAADAFKTANADALDKTITTITTADEDTVNAALTAFEALSDEAKDLLSGEKTLLDSLKARITALKSVHAFKTEHAGALDKAPDTVTAADEAAVNAALAAYEALGGTEKTLLKDEKDLLDSLKAKIDAMTGRNLAQEAADAFKKTHAAVLDKTETTVTAADEDAVNAALAAYEALSDEAKDLLSGEKTLLDSLKARTDVLTAPEKADAFKTTYATVLGKTETAVTAADWAAVNAALAAYEALGAEVKALLVTQKDLLDKLKAKISLFPGTGKLTFTLWVNDDEGLMSNIPEYPEIYVTKEDAGEPLTLRAVEYLINIQWSLNGVNIPAPRGTSREITLLAPLYKEGYYTLGLYAEKVENGVPVPYSTNITIMVAD